MAKIRSTITGNNNSVVNHSKATSHIHHHEECLSRTADGTHVYAQTNNRPVNLFVERASLRSRIGYDWNTGTYERKVMDVVDNARSQINTLKICPVTNGRHVESEKDQPWMTMGQGAIASVPVSSRSRKRGKK